MVQWGRSYLHWCLDSGKLVCVTSTLPEHSFTQFILHNAKISQEDLLCVPSLINESKTLGAVLLQRNLVTREDLQQMLFEHWSFLTYFLLLSGSYVFWSPLCKQLKSEFIRVDVPFSEMMLSCERSSIEVSGAIHLVQKLVGPYRLAGDGKLEGRLDEKEKRVVQYVRAGYCLGEMFRDAELDRMTCYKTLFILWLSGYLKDSSCRQTTSTEEGRKSILSRIRSFPRDWIFPLFAGVVIGALLAPPSAQVPREEPPARIERWKDIREKPAWTPPTEEEKPQMNTDEHK